MRLAAGATIVAAAGGGLLLGPLDVADANRDANGRPALIERAHCGRTSAVDSHARRASPSGLHQDVVVTVPRTAMIRVDARGIVRAAATNTGCAPRAGDDFFVIAPDGSVKAARADDFAKQHWSGNFKTPGEYVDQHGSVANR
jgi:hypothetical protein